MALQFERRLTAPVLATVAGFVDAASHLSFNIFTAHMSGNGARIGVYLAHGVYHELQVAAFAVLVFVVTITAVTAAMDILVRRGIRRPKAAQPECQACPMTVSERQGPGCSAETLPPPG